MVEWLALPKIGDVLAGKYELVRLIGKGGMGVVFEARHRRLKQRVAIKVLKPELIERSDCVARFEREGRAAGRLASPNVARVFDVDVTESGIPFMVIELLDGHDLSAELAQKQTLAVSDAVDIVLQACSAMAEAHALGVVHRDLKPANLFLCGKNSRNVKVLDFGISKVFADDDLSQATSPSLALGTPHYMSPEQILASKDVDPRSDVWSLGVILYKLLSGRFPFEGESATALVVAVATRQPRPLDDVPSVPPALAAAIMSALAKERADRWQRVEDFARAIERFGTGKIAFVPVAVRTSERASPAPSASPPDGAPTVVDHAGPVDVQPTQGNWTNAPHVSRRRARWIAPVGALAALAVVGGALGALRYAGTTRAPASAASAAPPAVTAEAPPPAAEPAPVVDVEPAPSSAASSAPVSPTRKPASPRPRPAASPKAPAPPPPRTPPAAPPPAPTKDPVHL